MNEHQRHGRRGGRTTLMRHGREHYRRIQRGRPVVLVGRIEVGLTAELAAGLAHWHEQTGIAKTQLVRQALGEWLAAREKRG